MIIISISFVICGICLILNQKQLYGIPVSIIGVMILGVYSTLIQKEGNWLIITPKGEYHATKLIEIEGRIHATLKNGGKIYVSAPYTVIRN